MKTALITGGAQRIGAQICRTLHQHNYNIIIHYHHSSDAAQSLANELNKARKNSASIIQAALCSKQDTDNLCNAIESLNVLVNNASVFYPTPIPALKQDAYQQMMNTNVMVPLFLSSALASKLKKNQGCIINIVDIHSQRPLKNYPIYSMSKAAIAMMTQSLAKELAPNIRVCGVSPGSILWPENATALSAKDKNKMLEKIALKKQGNATDIANTVLFLANSPYITGQIINVDGGRTLNQ